MSTNDQILVQKSLSRSQYLHIVRAALGIENYRFAHDTVINWLSSYPGDLKASLYYAQALIGMGRKQRALNILRGLCEADPEYNAAAETLLFSIPSVDKKVVLEIDQLISIFVLVGKPANLQKLAPWGKPLFNARRTLERGDLDKANHYIHQVFESGGENALAAVTHLRILSASTDRSPQKMLNLAEQYRQRWPECLALTLIFSHFLMQSGDTDLAVALIHQVVGRDVGGQVANRLWGIDHPYRALWPEDMDRHIEQPIPGEVATALGWNRLPVGRIEQFESPEQSAKLTVVKESREFVGEIPPDVFAEPDLIENNHSSFDLISAESLTEQIVNKKLQQPSRPERTGSKPGSITQSENDPVCTTDKDLSAVAEAFDRLALKVKLPGVVHLDGRFPVYVVFSLRNRLESIYGEKLANILDAEMWRLVESVRERPGWGARLYFADDALCANPLGIQPVQSGDPWDLKLALRDLDAALGKRGEQIGALLIVGGPEIVPFHHLPNPIDDQDDDVPSDNPYATRDENYFLPEWPVGRLPGGEGNDARFLLDTLRRMSAYHANQTRNQSWIQRWMKFINRFWELLRGNKIQGFGYTAAIWKKSASDVFRAIGKVDDLFVSPPLGLDGSGEPLPIDASQSSNGLCGVPIPNGRLGYFNLHGLVDAPEWYGQCDPLKSTDGPDYPVALRPQDLETQNDGQIPQIVLTEACYGLHIFDRSVDQALSLKFLNSGSMAVVGSTCMAYGSIGMPLIAADFLSAAFWRFLQEGMPVGEALRQAKIHLADVMNKRQGFLDVEDQKTLISFILYGDPLAQSVIKGRGPKVVRYLEKPLSGINTVTEGAEYIAHSQPMPADVMLSVKQVVKQYLPGMSDAHVAYVRENGCKMDERKHLSHGADDDGDQSSPALKNQKNTRQVITLSKEIKRTEGVHSLYARLTLNNEGELVKLVVSR